jgi:hypothetical protein
MKISEAQQKFDYYVVALDFTLLAAAVQTAKFGTSQISDLLELTAWVLLLVAGVLALWRLEWMHVVDRLAQELHTTTEERVQLVKGKAEGSQSVLVASTQQVSPIDVQIGNRDESLKQIQARLDNLDRSAMRKYSVARWGFVLGLASLVAARAYLPALELLNACRLTRHCS